MMFASVLRGFVAVALVLLSLSNVSARAGEVRVAVASNFAMPMQRIADLFQRQSGHTVKTTVAASGKLYAKIVGGAQFDVLLSADEELPKRLVQDGLAAGGSRFVYATGRLVLWSAQPSLVDEKGKVLRNGNFNRLAIAHPSFAPYGKAAKEALEKLAMWNGMQRKLVKGEDVSKAYQLAATENADLAFVGLSQIMHDGKVSEGSWWMVPTDLYRPIRQSAVLLSGAQDQQAAQALLDFLKGDQAAAVMRSFGYALP